MPVAKQKIKKIYHTLLKNYGTQQWWPAETPFETMVGAILTQNTSWTNVEKAIQQLKDHNALDPEMIANIMPNRLASLIKSSGYYNQKAQRLQSFCQWFLEAGGFHALQKRPTPELRRDLLALNGIGPETADSMLLYAFQRPSFVIDTYTQRLSQRIGIIMHPEKYDILKTIFEQSIPPNTEIYNEYHALIVQHAKMACRKKPICENCCLQKICNYHSK